MEEGDGDGKEFKDRNGRGLWEKPELSTRRRGDSQEAAVTISQYLKGFPTRGEAHRLPSAPRPEFRPRGGRHRPGDLGSWGCRG